MSTPPTDSLRRATFAHIPPRQNVRPTDRELRWFKHIERHGSHSSECLFELTRGTHRCKDTALRDLQKLRAGGYLLLPRQQRQTERAEFNPYIYDLSRYGKQYLAGCGIAEATIRPTGHWWHGYTVSAITGAWDILAAREGNQFIPAHEILERNGADLAIPMGKNKLIPDQLFAIRYQDGYRAFLLEVDRATEPYRSAAARKSIARTIDQYAILIQSDRHRQHYGLKASTAILWAFTSPTRLSVFQQMVRDRAPRLADHFLCKSLPERLSWTSLKAFHYRAWIGCKGTQVAGL